jgi:Icc-related predicted phosphoesterase
MRFLCISDIHGRAETLPALLDEERKGGIGCIIVAGDITQAGGSAEARNVLRPLLDSGLPLFAVHGNMDLDGALRFIEEKGIGIHGKTVVFDGVSITGVGGSNITPLGTPTEYTEAELSDILVNYHPENAVPRNRILVSHTPPLETRLDRLKSGAHVGSLVIKEYIIRETIRLCITGHIHESAGIDKIGECTCVNAGAYKEGKYCIVDFDTITGESAVELRKVNDLWKRK